MNIIVPSTEMRLKPSVSSTLETECLFGEYVEILDINSEWLYCKLATDNYCGWINKNSIGFLKRITHRVIAKRSFLLIDKDVKSNIIHDVPMGSQLSVKSLQHNWAEVYLSQYHDHKTAFIPRTHIVEINHRLEDWVSSAEKLIETPYKWGGRNTIGIDCSALLQLSYQTFGENIPRNTNEQSKLPKQVITNIKDLNRGYVIFWKGHVAIMVDKFNCLHANAYHMKTIIEPIDNIIKRFKGKNSLLKIMNFN